MTDFAFMHKRARRHTMFLFLLVWIVLGEPYASALKQTLLLHWSAVQQEVLIVVMSWLLYGCCFAFMWVMRVVKRWWNGYVLQLSKPQAISRGR